MINKKSENFSEWAEKENIKELQLGSYDYWLERVKEGVMSLSIVPLKYRTYELCSSYFDSFKDDKAVQSIVLEDEIKFVPKNINDLIKIKYGLNNNIELEGSISITNSEMNGNIGFKNR